MNQRVMVKFTKLQAFYYHHHEIRCKVAKKGMGGVENSWKKQDPNSGDIDGDEFFSQDNSIIETQKVIINITLNYSASLEIKIVKIVEAIFHQHHSRFSWLRYEKKVVLNYTWLA